MGSNPAAFWAETIRQKMHKEPWKDRPWSIILILKYFLLDLSCVMATQNISVAAFVDFLAEICFENFFSGWNRFKAKISAVIFWISPPIHISFFPFGTISFAKWVAEYLQLQSSTKCPRPLRVIQLKGSQDGPSCWVIFLPILVRPQELRRGDHFSRKVTYVDIIWGNLTPRRNWVDRKKEKWDSNPWPFHWLDHWASNVVWVNYFETSAGIFNLLSFTSNGWKNCSHLKSVWEIQFYFVLGCDQLGQASATGHLVATPFLI